MTNTTSAKTETVNLGGVPWWIYGLLGVVFIIAGLFVLNHLVAASVVSAFVFGVVLLIAGGAEIAHAFMAKNWGGFAFNLAVGILYVLAGGVLVSNPAGAVFPLTLAFTALLLASGIIRLFLAYRYWDQFGWLLTLSGLIAILAAGVIISGWPMTGLWVLGLLLGVDLLFFGFWWIVYAFVARRAA